MVLSASMNEILGKVFTIFGVFWVIVLVVLFVGVGALTRRHDRILRQRNAGHAGPPH